MWYEQTGFALCNLLFCAVVAGCDDRQSGCPGLADHMRHSLASREPYEDIEPGQQARHIRAITEEIEQSAEPEIARKGAEFVIVLRHKRIGPADHQEARLPHRLLH